MNPWEDVARRSANAASEAAASARSAELAVTEVRGMFVSLSSALNEHVRECRELREAMHNGHDSPPPHSVGRRDYDADDPPTSPGSLYKRVHRGKLARMEQELRGLTLAKERDDKDKREAELIARGAAEEIKKWRRRASRLLAFGVPAAGAVGWILHALWPRLFPSP